MQRFYTKVGSQISILCQTHKFIVFIGGVGMIFFKGGLGRRLTFFKGFTLRKLFSGRRETKMLKLCSHFCKISLLGGRGLKYVKVVHSTSFGSIFNMHESSISVVNFSTQPHFVGGGGGASNV